MVLTTQIVSEAVRQRLGLSDDSKAAGIIAQIPEALKLTGRKIAADPALRPLLISDKTTATLPITTGGQVDLSTGYGSFKFLLEFFDCGQCYLASSGTASGIWTFAFNPSHGETIVVNGVTFTFVYPDVTLAGADTGFGLQNGQYTYRGMSASRPFWNFHSDPDDPLSQVFVDFGGSWVIRDGNTDIAYAANAAADFPWEVLVWNPQGGLDPLGSVTEGSLTSVQVAIGFTPADTATNFAAALNASVDPLLTVATYVAATNQVTGTYNTPGSTGDTFTMAESSESAVTVSGATFEGGGSSGDDLPMQRLTSPQQASLPNYLDSIFTYFYIQSNVLYVLPASTTGAVIFANPTYPTNLAALPDSQEAEIIFLDTIAQMLMPPPKQAGAR